MEKQLTRKAKKKEAAVEANAATETFDRFVAMDQIVDKLVQNVLRSADEVDPNIAADMLGKIALAYERLLNVQKLHRENLESINGTTRKVIFDCTIIAPREPGDPDAK